jgi:redox-sensitive bicupin YhaK (pirin superfamily)
MFQIRKHHERGHANHGWLDTFHTFSFASYQDPQHIGFRALRVMNEDRVQPGGGFGMHGHRDMEIITYVLAGELEHKDSMGNGEVLRAGEFQRMTAGTGIRHSEFNPSATQEVHLYQIWLLPERNGLAPTYEQRSFPEVVNHWQLVASPDASNGVLTIRQDARLHLARLTAGTVVDYSLAAERHAWLQVLRGDVRLNGIELTAGDGVAISGEPRLTVETSTSAEVLLFDLA